jgi:hypothetical protein
VEPLSFIHYSCSSPGLGTLSALACGFGFMTTHLYNKENKMELDMNSLSLDLVSGTGEESKCMVI